MTVKKKSKKNVFSNITVKFLKNDFHKKTTTYNHNYNEYMPAVAILSRQNSLLQDSEYGKALSLNVYKRR